MNNSFLLAEDFENIVREYYLAAKYTFIEANPSGRDRGYDFLVKAPSGETVAVAVKTYRTRVVQRADIIRAVTIVESSRQWADAAKGALFISSAMAIGVNETGATALYDIRAFAEMLKPYPRLLGRLHKLARELAPTPITPEEKLEYAIFGNAYLPMSDPAEPEGLVQQGVELCRAIREVPPGKSGASAFEERCFDALKYIFEGHFANWQKQSVTDGGISRFDLVARISSSHGLWQSIVGFFRSWYVVFEFKNYTDKITQGEIYTTEKYLFAGAMRTVAIIVSTKGADENAMAATRGAARESGKLIIHLTVDDICKMLDLKDSGGDPNGIMLDEVDKMLMKLER